MIPQFNLNKEYSFLENEIQKELKKVFFEKNFIGGENVTQIEKNIAKYIGVNYAASCNSGTDALYLALNSIGIRKGDEVITTPNSFIASTASIIHIGAIPKFVDVLDDQNINPDQIERQITKKTKAIMPVHLTGRVCQMDKILKIAKKHSLYIIEDAAQAIGSKFKNKFAGSFSDIACFSTHPLKNLNASGDGGFLVTNNKKYRDKASLLINHGIKNRNKISHFGYVSRMDTLQAAILNFRLKNLDNVIQKRRENADIYFNELNQKNILLPIENKNEFNTYHTFVIQSDNRDKLQKYLLKKGINTAIHYPIPIHKQKAYKSYSANNEKYPNAEKQSKKILSLPINQYLLKKEIVAISKEVNNFYKFR